VDVAEDTEADHGIGSDLEAVVAVAVVARTRTCISTLALILDV
jgi:hypothetical protein